MDPTDMLDDNGASDDFFAIEPSIEDKRQVSENVDRRVAALLSFL
jgi:hypothetical protein